METDNAAITEKIVKGIYTLSPRRRGKSLIWNVLAEILKEDGNVLEGFCCCRNCRKVLKFVNNQTSNLCRHKCCKSVKNPLALTTVTLDDRQLAIDTCTEWIIEDCLPFSSASGSGFAKLIKFFIKIGARYGEFVCVEDLLSEGTTISHKVRAKADKIRESLSTEIKNIVKNGDASATIEMWPDRYLNRNFLLATLHYQKNFGAFNIVLGLKSIDVQKSTSESVKIKLKKIFNKFGVEDFNTIKFVTDQEAIILQALENKTHLSCSSHLLARVLDKSFEETCELKETLDSCKKLVKYLKRVNLQHKLPTSVRRPLSTWWDSKYTMLTAIANNWIDITKTLGERVGTSRELNIKIPTLAALVELCKHFEVIFKKLQVFNSPSLSFVLPSIYKIKSLCILNSNDIPAISALKENIVKNIDLIWVKNLSMWHMAAFFLFPPAVSKQQNDLKNIKEFCISQIISFDNCEKASTSKLLINNSTCPETSRSNKMSTVECTSTKEYEYDDLIDIKETCISENENFIIYQASSNSQPCLGNNLASTTDDNISTSKDNDLIDIKEPFISQITNVHNCEATSTTQALLSNDLSNTSNSTINTKFSVDEYVSKNNENQFFFANWLDTSESSNTLKETAKDEVEKYSKETVKMTEDFDLIQWWRNNEKHYPRLSKFAFQIHSIPASCAASEHAFSLVGNIITEKRCRLEPKSLDSLLFLNSYFKNFSES